MSVNENGRPVQPEPELIPVTGPTGRLRVLDAGTAQRLQAEWVDAEGPVWRDVPIVRVAALPPKTAEVNPGR